jgi:hypothetical protein
MVFNVNILQLVYFYTSKEQKENKIFEGQHHLQQPQKCYILGVNLKKNIQPSTLKAQNIADIFFLKSLNRAGRASQAVGPEFKHQYHWKKKKKA